MTNFVLRWAAVILIGAGIGLWVSETLVELLPDLPVPVTVTP